MVGVGNFSLEDCTMPFLDLDPVTCPFLSRSLPDNLELEAMQAGSGQQL